MLDLLQAKRVHGIDPQSVGPEVAFRIPDERVFVCCAGRTPVASSRGSSSSQLLSLPFHGGGKKLLLSCLVLGFHTRCFLFTLIFHRQQIYELQLDPLGWKDLKNNHHVLSIQTLKRRCHKVGLKLTFLTKCKFCLIRSHKNTQRWKSQSETLLLSFKLDFFRNDVLVFLKKSERTERQTFSLVQMLHIYLNWDNTFPTFIETIYINIYCIYLTIRFSSQGQADCSTDHHYAGALFTDYYFHFYRRCTDSQTHI